MTRPRSMSEWRRLVKQGAVTYNGVRVVDPKIEVGQGGFLQCGKRGFFQIVLEQGGENER